MVSRLLIRIDGRLDEPLSGVHLVYNDQHPVGSDLGPIAGLPAQQLGFRLVYLTHL